MNEEFSNRRVVVMGLGRFGGGIGAAQWLARQGAKVTITDRADESSLAKSIARLDGLGIEFRCGVHDPAVLERAELLVVSPAVDKRRSTFVGVARRRGIPISSEMNLFVERCRGRITGVTGTTGKSTTCAMLYGILRAGAARGELGGGQAHLGGNIGRSLLAELEHIGPDDLVVLELSSFQLEDLAALKMSPSVAVITNVSPRHLDRHGSFTEYVTCKLNVCRYQRAGDVVVLGSDDRVPPAPQHSALRTQDSALSTQHSSLSSRVAQITGRTGASIVSAAEPDDLNLKVLGKHNRRNAAVAMRAAELLGVGRETALEALARFDGLPHRLQFVRRVDGAAYYNDSKATSPEAVAAALSSFDRAVILLLGGQARTDSWDAVSVVRERIKGAICAGENGRALADMLGGTAVATLAEAVEEARRRAGQGDVVLFSPGSPSFDQFANYEVRGDAFVRLVEEL